ncbi:MAG: hypothetical protein Q4D90_10560, partial [bacterium]|nr:hypothetical protein [bacterium]
MSEYERKEPSSRRRTEAADRERIRKVQEAASRGRGEGTARSTSSNRVGEANRRSAYSSASSARRRKRRRRGGEIDIVRVLLAAGALILLLCLLAVGIKSCQGKKPSTPVGDENAMTSGSSEPETEMEQDITVAGVSLSGLTQSAAKENILASVNWDMKVTYNGEEMEVSNVLEVPLETLLSSIYSGTSRERDYSLETLDVSETAAAAAAA